MVAALAALVEGGWEEAAVTVGREGLVAAWVGVAREGKVGAPVAVAR